MDSNSFLLYLIDKSSSAKKEDLKSKITTLQNVELPDDFKQVLDSFYTEESAKSKNEISEFYRQKFDEDEKRIVNSKLTQQGFNQHEIDEILSLPKEIRSERMLKIFDSKVQDKYKLSQTEKDLQYEAKIKLLEDKIIGYQAQYIEYDNKIERIKKEEATKAELKSLINGLPFSTSNNSLPKQEASKFLYQRIQDQLLADNFSILFKNGSPILVKKDDETSHIFDEKNNVVDANRYINDIARNLNLLESPNNLNQNINYSTTSSNNSTLYYQYNTKTNNNSHERSNQYIKSTVSQILNKNK